MSKLHLKTDVNLPKHGIFHAINSWNALFSNVNVANVGNLLLCVDDFFWGFLLLHWVLWLFPCKAALQSKIQIEQFYTWHMTLVRD